MIVSGQTGLVSDHVLKVVVLGLNWPKDTKQCKKIMEEAAVAQVNKQSFVTSRNVQGIMVRLSLLNLLFFNVGSFFIMGHFLDIWDLEGFREIYTFLKN